MRLGLHIVSFTWPDAPASIGPTLRDIARAAEDAGFYSLSVMDHFFQMESMGDPAQPMLEAYSALNYLAASTDAGKLGALVTGVIYRHPGALIKTVTALDVLSGGRAELGIGAGWYEREARGLGLPFPPTKERFERLEETLQIAHHMWSGDAAPLRRPALHARRADQQPAAYQQAASADHHRRTRASERRSGSSRSTAMPATCSRSGARNSCARNSMCCATIATRSGARTSRSSARDSSLSTSARRALTT